MHNLTKENGMVIVELAVYLVLFLALFLVVAIVFGGKL